MHMSVSFSLRMHPSTPYLPYGWLANWGKFWWKAHSLLTPRSQLTPKPPNKSISPSEW